jgi:hypothetical protein
VRLGGCRAVYFVVAPTLFTEPLDQGCHVLGGGPALALAFKVDLDLVSRDYPAPVTNGQKVKECRSTLLDAPTRQQLTGVGVEHEWDHPWLDVESITAALLMHGEGLEQAVPFFDVVYAEEFLDCVQPAVWQFPAF